jgi:hypothetical protein
MTRASCTVQRAMWTVCAALSAQGVLCSVLYPVYSVQCVVYSVQCKVVSVQCAVIHHAPLQLCRRKNWQTRLHYCIYFLSPWEKGERLYWWCKSLDGRYPGPAPSSGLIPHFSPIMTTSATCQSLNERYLLPVITAGSFSHPTSTLFYFDPTCSNLY